MSKLKGKVAFITGGSQGIGEATALLFAEEGATVAVLASHDKAKAQSVVDKIRKSGGKALALVGDVTKAAEMTTAVKTAEKELGPIDILVCSAGIFRPTAIGSTPESEYDQHMDVNVKGTWNAISAVVNSMKKRKTGWIVNVSSVLGEMGLAGYAVYGASKAAINTMTKCLAIELGREGIRVNAIAPGNTATPMNHELRTNPEYKGFIDTMTVRTPSPRVYSEAADMARAILYLSCDDSRAVRGAILTLDEGLSLGV